jgi:hypothetical protein
MHDIELAKELIFRLNQIIKDPVVKNDIKSLLETRIVCSDRTAAHSTIQVISHPNAVGDSFGFLGLLNGIVGTIPFGKYTGWGFIAASYDDAGNLEYFQLLEHGEDVPPTAS